MFFLIWCLFSLLSLTLSASNMKKFFAKSGYQSVHTHEQFLTPREQAEQLHQKNMSLLTRALSPSARPTQQEVDQAIIETNNTLNVLPQEYPKKEQLRKQFQALAYLSQSQPELIDRKK